MNPMCFRLVVVIAIGGMAGCAAEPKSNVSVGNIILASDPKLVTVVAVPIEGVDSAYVAKCDYQTDWWGYFTCVGVIDGMIVWEARPREEQEPDEQSILSASSPSHVKWKCPLIEVYGQTHQGNGDFYLYEFKNRSLTLLLKTRAVDRNDSEGRILRGGRLTASYEDLNHDGLSDVVLHGYLSESETDPFSMSRPVRKVFVWDVDRNALIEDPRRERNPTW